MRWTTAKIAEAVDGTLDGNPDIEIKGVEALDVAGPAEISFLANSRYAAAAAATQAAAVLVHRDWDGICAGVVIRVADPDAAFARVASLLRPAPPAIEPGIHASAAIADEADLDASVSVGPFCVIERGVRIGPRTVLGAGCYVGADSVIGAQCHLYPNVSVRERTEIGDRVIVHMGAVLGSDGFGYVPKDGAWEKIPQTGTVQIGDDVELGANVTVDRARFGKTVIATGAKIDNLVQVAHNVRIGEHTAIAALSGISGSTTVGRNVRIGGSAGLSGHIHIGDFSAIGAMAGVTKDVPEKTFVSGFPAMPHRAAQKMQASVRRLPELKKKLQDMEQRLQALESKTK